MNMVILIGHRSSETGYQLKRLIHYKSFFFFFLEFFNGLCHLLEGKTSVKQDANSTTALSQTTLAQLNLFSRYSDLFFAGEINLSTSTSCLHSAAPVFHSACFRIWFTLSLDILCEQQVTVTVSNQIPFFICKDHQRHFSLPLSNIQSIFSSILGNMVQIQVLESIMNLMRNDEMITMMSLFLPSVTGMPDFIFCFPSQFIVLVFLNY